MKPNPRNIIYSFSAILVILLTSGCAHSEIPESNKQQEVEPEIKEGATDTTYIEYLDPAQISVDQSMVNAEDLAKIEHGKGSFGRKGQRALIDALHAMQEGQWTLAIDHFNQAKSKFEDVELFREELTVVREQKSMAFFEMAQDIYDLRLKGGDLDQAEKLLQKACEINPENTEVARLRVDIEKFRKRSRE